MCDSVCHPSTDLYLWREHWHFSHTSQRGWDVFSSHRRGVCDSHLSFRAIRAPVLLFPGETSDISPSSEIQHRFTKFAEISGLAFTLFSRICLPSARFWEFFELPPRRFPEFTGPSTQLLERCWSRSPSFKKKKTSRNARFLEWLSSRMRQHSHGRESCTCRLLHSFFFKDGSIVQDLDLESSSFFCNFLSSIFFWRVKTYRYQCSTLWPSLLMIKSLCCGALPLIRLCILEALYKCVYLYYYYYFHNHPLHN